MPAKREWKKSEPTKSCACKIASYPGSSLYAEAMCEHSSSTNPGYKKYPVHQSTSHRLQECKKFGMSTSKKEKVMEEHKLCLTCLLPGHRLKKCRKNNRCKVEGCGMYPSPYHCS